MTTRGGEAVANERERLFGIVPADVFRAFAGRSRHFYARLLTYLAEDVFSYVGDSVTRKRALAAIGEFIDRQERGLVVEALGETDVATPASAPQIAYDRLKETGWLVEYPDRYQRVVDFDPAARLLLQALIDIESGRLRSYGGAVLNVVTVLRSVLAQPIDNAINVREAALAARSFMAHLKTVRSALRQVEARVMAQPSANALIKSFIDEFIQSTVVQDYRNLHTRESPFRFRIEILEIVDQLLADPAMVAVIAQGYRRAGLQPGSEVDVVEDLRSISRTFSAVDQHVAAIEETTFRIERRIVNVVTFSGRINPLDTAEMLRALALLGASALDDDADIGVDPYILGEDPVLDARHFYLPHRGRPSVGESEVPLRERDPALDLYHAALDIFEARIAITPAMIRDYLERVFAGRQAIDSDALPIETLDDFLVVERIHEVTHPPLNAEYRMELLPGTMTTDWIERQAFRISRRAGRG